jgi:hypothetical protein
MHCRLTPLALDNDGQDDDDPFEDGLVLRLDIP